MKPTGTLYLVATPIGNLEDITQRALRLLAEVDLIAAEDTRVTRKLLSHYQIRTPLTSYHRHSRPGKLTQLLGRLRQGDDLALVSDAGMPGLSDPGARLVLACAAEGVPVVPIPGPSALITALALSGLPAPPALFLGFLPASRKRRREAIRARAGETATLLLFEPPHRLAACLSDLLLELGDRFAVVAREMTKKFEEVRRGSLSQHLAYFLASPPRGEIVIVVEGAKATGAARREEEEERGETDLRAQALSEAEALIARGMSASQAARLVSSRCRLPRRAIYRLLLERRRGE
jgi:16S rRNA (cytidine1402-2'-O)-methyltransferase